MKKRIFTFICFVLVATSSMIAQTLQEKAKALLKPADCGIANFDGFKNSSFSLKDDVLKTDANYSLISSEITKYAKGEKKLTISNVKADMKKVKNVNGSIKTLNDKVANLTNDGKNLTAAAAKVQPAGKAQAVNSNTQNSVKAVDLSRDILNNLSKKVNLDLGTLTSLLPKAAKR